ncbi:MAG: DUF488 family protein [Candidatus Hodarchaeota archaeon]
MGIKTYTIGFTKKSAEQFFNSLIKAGVKRIIDIRLNNKSQLAGFAKKNDLEYFLKKIAGIEYVHVPLLAPSEEILKEYKKNKGDWSVYERDFMNLMEERKIENRISPELLDNGCLLCSEATPEHCHRRLVLEYLNSRWGNIEIQHII